MNFLRVFHRLRWNVVNSLTGWIYHLSRRRWIYDRILSLRHPIELRLRRKTISWVSRSIFRLSKGNLRWFGDIELRWSLRCLCKWNMIHPFFVLLTTFLNDWVHNWTSRSADISTFGCHQNTIIEIFIYSFFSFFSSFLRSCTHFSLVIFIIFYLITITEGPSLQTEDSFH